MLGGLASCTAQLSAVSRNLCSDLLELYKAADRHVAFCSMSQACVRDAKPLEGWCLKPAAAVKQLVVGPAAGWGCCCQAGVKMHI